MFLFVCLCWMIATALTLFHCCCLYLSCVAIERGCKIEKSSGCDLSSRPQTTMQTWQHREMLWRRIHPCRLPPSIPSRLHLVNLHSLDLPNAKIFFNLSIIHASLFYYACPISVVAFDQGEELDMTIDKDDNDANGSAAAAGVDQDMYGGDLQTFENSGPVFHQFRRKSIIPVDETVLTELSRHRSLDEVLNEPPSPSTSATFAHHHIPAPGTGVGTASSQPVLPVSDSSSDVNHVQET